MYNTSKSGENRLRGDKMKQEKFSKVLKTKGFYLSLLTGVLAVAAICFVYFSTTGKDNTNDLTDLNNKPSQQQSANDNNANTPGEDGKGTVVKNTATPETETKTNTGTKKEEQVVRENEVTKDPNASAEKKEKDEAVAAVQQDSSSKLTFTQEEELAWPVTGNVVIPYDMEHGVLFATLGQYKCSDAIVISAKEGTKVKSAVKGKVTNIVEDEETGVTLTMDIGSDYSVVYGQLKNLKVEKGDMVEAGDVIGVIAKPTKYYVVEGANLYFKVIQDEQPVNPMYLLK